MVSDKVSPVQIAAKLKSKFEPRRVFIYLGCFLFDVVVFQNKDDVLVQSYAVLRLSLCKIYVIKFVVSLFYMFSEAGEG